MPFTFLLFLVFMLCAVISPLVAVGAMWALCTERWRYAGWRVSKMGGILAAISIATYFSLNALLGDGAPVRPISIAIAGGAGFTAGAAGICAWIWVRSRKRLATAD
jgi:hypothetical protein